MPGSSAINKRRNMNPGSSLAGSSVGDDDDLSRDFDDPTPEPNIQEVTGPRALLSVAGASGNASGSKGTLLDMDEEYDVSYNFLIL